MPGGEQRGAEEALTVAVVELPTGAVVGQRRELQRERERGERAGLGKRVSEGAAWSQVAQALFNLKEFLYLR